MATVAGACAVIAFWSLLAICAVAGMTFDYPAALQVAAWFLGRIRRLAA